MGVDTVWEEALAYIESRVPKQVFDTWFLPLHSKGVEESCLRLEVPNKFFSLQDHS